MDKFADELDRASAIEQAANEECVAKARRAAGPEQECINGKWETEECRDCGELIEPGRLQMGKCRCFQCQSALELRRKQGLR